MAPSSFSSIDTRGKHFLVAVGIHRALIANVREYKKQHSLRCTCFDGFGLASRWKEGAHK